jgi:hypothetical protein
MSDEKYEQLELPFPSVVEKPKANPSVKEVDKVTECMKTWAMLKDGYYVCQGCGGQYATIGFYNNHLALPRRRQ